MNRYLTLLLAVVIGFNSPLHAQDKKSSSRFTFPTKKGKGKLNDINFNDLKFDIKKGESFRVSQLTKKIKKLNNAKIKIRGYILPSSVFEQKGFKQFVLVRDNMECCFGPGAAIYDCIVVEMDKGKSADFSVRPVTVEGKFRLKPYKGPDGKYLAIYHLTGHKVAR